MAATKLPMPREHTGTRQGDATQQNAERTAQAVNRMPFANGNLVESLVIGAGATVNVEHKLGRVPRGFFVTWAITPFAPYVNGTATDKTIPLKCDAVGAGSLWFF